MLICVCTTIRYENHSCFNVFGGISILYLPKDKDGLLYIVKRKKYATR